MSKETLFVAISNQKGGVGKSALSVVLASYFHFEKGLNVAIVDCDSPQHSLVRMRERDKKAVSNSAYYRQLIKQQWNQVQKKAKSGEKESVLRESVMRPVIEALKAGKPARTAAPDPTNKDACKEYKMLQLLTSKPVLYVCNVDEDSAASGNDFSKKVFAKAEAEGAKAVIISGTNSANGRDAATARQPFRRNLSEKSLISTGKSRRRNCGSPPGFWRPATGFW